MPEYLDKLNWTDITRDERFFCSELYRVVYGCELEFVHWLKKIISLDLNTSNDWTIVPEVCFYRDYEMHFPDSITSDMYSPKRTFDICLFGDEQVVIIEAKSHQEMPLAEARRIQNDAANVQCILKLRSRPTTVALVSDDYRDNHQLYSRKKPLSYFDGVITWGELENKYNNKIFWRANSIYKDGNKIANKGMQRTRKTAGR